MTALDHFGKSVHWVLLPNQRESNSLEALEHGGDIDVLHSDSHGADEQGE